MTAASADGAIEGGSRICAPEKTWSRLEPLLPAFGIARVADITGLDRIGIPVFMACRPNSRSLSVFQGKGLTAAAARVSAAMEAYETWCAERIEAPLKLASIDQLRFSHPLADIDGLALSTAAGPDFQQPILWIEAADLLGGGMKWLPFETVHANYALPEPTHSGAFTATTNGLASGNSAEEAVLHALLEVVERDATTLWKLGEHAWSGATAVDLATVSGAPRHLLDLFEAAEISVAVWDCRSDVGIPTFLCLIHDRTGETGADEIGCGTHTVAEIALVRALTEAAQARCTYVAGAREDITARDYTSAAINERRERAMRVLSALRPSVDYASIRSTTTGAIGLDIDGILERLSAIGINEALTCDLSQPGLPFSVCRVVVPGLEAALEGPGTAYVPGKRASAILRRTAAAQ